jgi:hypothetical protein
MPEFKGIQISPIARIKAKIRLDTTDGTHTEFEISFSDLVALSRFLTRKVTSIASQNGGANGGDVKLLTDAVPAQKAEVNNDLLGETVYLAIEDQYGRVAWKLQPGPAAALGQQLLDRARELSKKSGARN